MLKDVTILAEREVDSYECTAWVESGQCSNTSHHDGFEPCLMDGTVVEPLLHGPWQGLYKCMNCSAIHMVLSAPSHQDEIFLHIKHNDGEEITDTLQSFLWHNVDSLDGSEINKLHTLEMGEIMHFGGGAMSCSTVMRVWPDEESRDEHLRLPSLRRHSALLTHEIERITDKSIV
jgi:hypothetical protein